MSFELDKKNILVRADKSEKGSFDAPIMDLLDKINTRPEYYTTSSCSGRIVIIARDGHKKDGAIRILNSHKEVGTDEVWSLVNASKEPGIIWFLFEGLILHITCKDKASAESLLRGSQMICKHSGIVCTDPWRLEIRASEKIEAILAKDHKIIVSKEHLQVLVEEANGALERNNAIIKRVSELF